MRKIKDNGRTYKNVKRYHDCRTCTYDKNKCKKGDCYTSFWRETIPSKFSRLIKRMVNKCKTIG